MSDIPRIISVDDHVVEPPDLWSARLPASRRDEGPHVVRRHGVLGFNSRRQPVLLESDSPQAGWSDVWCYEEMAWPFHVGYANVGRVRDEGRLSRAPMTYDEMLPGCFERGARLADMDENHTEASLCFPTVPRFCGQTFLEREDKELALECVRIYNDWMIDEWCGGEAKGRLIPLTIIPLWDVELAAAEIRRCAGKGSHAVCFAECMHPLGLPSLYTGYWEPFLAACAETGTVVNMHIGSSSVLPTTSPDAPAGAGVSLTFENAMHAMVDWLLSGALSRHDGLKIAFSEGQVGWMPFILQRLDDVWERAEMYEGEEIRRRVPQLPSSYVPGRVYGCIFNDAYGLKARDVVGMGQIMFETDYPHSDSAFPLSKGVAEKLVAEAGLSEHETWQFVRGNAIECYGLARYGYDA